MTDRELLELAAKAVGFKIISVQHGKLNCHDSQCKRNFHWNPLIDDGDALRLVVDLQLSIEFATCEDDAPIVIVGYRYNKAQECLAPDFKAKTRRAIVREAAEIGKAMQ